MTDELQPSTIRSHEFSAVRRGYDRDEVDRFKASVADRVAALEAQLASITGRLGQLGIADPGDLQSELETVAGEVDKILTAAREAAAGLRSRAAEDAARWRAEAESEVSEARRTAGTDAEMARGSAWEAAATLMEETKAEADRLLQAADQDALFIRAQAEREALRLTGDARRDAEEELRAARSEGERMLIEARAESESTLATARQAAAAAQDRARALEARRGELMEELETARLSIGQVEEERDAQREAAIAPPTSPASSSPRGSGADAGEWLDNDASVRIVPANLLPIAEEPVDADALAEEVAALRAAAAAEPTEAPEVPYVPDPVGIVVPDLDVEAPMPVVAEPVEPAPAEPAPVVAGPAPEEPEPEPVEAHPVEPEPEPEEPEAEPPEPVVLPDPSDEAEEFESESPAAEPVPVEPAPPSEIDSLFAELREPMQESAAPSEPEPVVEPEPTTLAESEPAATVAAEPSESTSAAATDPFELRDRFLLPIQNRTLRTLKRRIVDLQNRVLEELRVSQQEWSVDRAMVAATVSEDLARVSQESYVAGYAGAAELAGAGAAPPPGGGATFDASADFVDGIVAAVTEALDRTRAGDGGARQVSAAVSRVFRAWRTDEAERRVRRSGFRAYDEGLVDAFAALGVAQVMCVSPGRPCGICPAGTGATWAPGQSAPAPLPPATPSCEATVVPAR